MRGVSASTAWIQAMAVQNMLDGLLSSSLTVGTLRRLTESEKDIASLSEVDIVVLPNDTPTLHARIDKLVTLKHIRQALNYKSQVIQWDNFQRAIVAGSGDLRVNLFIAQPHTYGSLVWMLTEAPQTLEHLAWHYFPPLGIRIDERGQVIDTDSGQVINVPDEETMFKLLGIYPIRPDLRDLPAYVQAIDTAPKRTPRTFVALPNVPQQITLF